MTCLQGRSRRAYMEYLKQRNFGGILVFLETFIRPRSWNRAKIVVARKDRLYIRCYKRIVTSHWLEVIRQEKIDSYNHSSPCNSFTTSLKAKSNKKQRGWTGIVRISRSTLGSSLAGQKRLKAREMWKNSGRKTGWSRGCPKHSSNFDNDVQQNKRGNSFRGFP